MTPDLYQAALERVSIATENIDQDKVFKKVLDVVEKDLHRTFADLGHFRKGGFLYQPLKNILSAFALYRSDLSYV